MKRISYKNDLEICFDKIKPFINICKITGKEELCNITIRYIPNEYILEIGSYREYFSRSSPRCCMIPLVFLEL